MRKQLRLVDIDLLMEVVNKTGLSAKVEPFEGNAIFVRAHEIGDRLKKLEHDLRLVKDQVNDGDSIVQVHVPNLSLLSFNTVAVLEDCCTDSLQKELDGGWRILAVCPPSTSDRRPTYIVAKNEPR